MTQEKAKELWPIICAYSEGKTVEYFKDGKWIELKDPEFYGTGKYRIKPEPKYRPFKDAEECFEEMRKHEPIGWIKSTLVNYRGYITGIRDYGVYCDNDCRSFKTAFNSVLFADGTPFGVKED